VRWISTSLGLALAMLATSNITYAFGCHRCGGCSDPCGGGAVMSSGCGGAAAMSSGGCVAGGEMICDTVTDYKVVMEPKYVTETRSVCVTETRNETRYRTKQVWKTVPVTETKYRTKVVNKPVTETKTIEYSVLVPVKSEKTVELTESVPVWTEVPEEYTVRVPQLVEVPETYTVKVPQLRDETFTYTVNVPHAVTEQRMRTVTNAVPVTRTRTIQVCVPQTTTKCVTKDYGHWEERVVEAPASSVSSGPGAGMGCGSRRGGCGLLGRLHGHHRSCGCRSCASACSSCGSNCGGGCGAGNGCGATKTQRVWVPNVVTENVPVTTMSNQSQTVHYTVYEQRSEQIPYECTRVVYRPEQRTGTKKSVHYEDEERTRMRKVVKYTEEKRTRMRKQLTYKTVTKTETVPQVSYKTEKRTKEVSYTYNVPEYTTEAYEVTRNDRVCEEQVEEYTVCVPYVVAKEQQVQVCKMVPKLVETTVNHCCEGSAASAGAPCGGCDAAAGSDCGCGAPAASPCGCN